MDPALLREREAFKKRAMAVPVVEKRPIKDDSDRHKSKKQKVAPKSAPKQPSAFDYKAVSGSSQYKFAILAKTVKHMKTRHQEGETFALTIDEILDETNQLDIGQRQRHWLQTEALISNPKIEVIEGDKFRYKPKYKIPDRKKLMKLLENHDMKGLGGILMDDVEESLPNCAKVLKHLGDRITTIMRPIDKKKVLFYNDKSFNFTVDEDIQKLWRGVAVDGVDEGKIDDYLKKHGITSMHDVGVKVAPIQKRKRKGKKGTFAKHNDHLEDILQDYSNVTK